MNDLQNLKHGQEMTGAESLVHTLLACGVDTCFTNPGTSEMHLVAALDRIDGVRPVLVLFEGVASAAADGYGRMTGRPAYTLLHLGPGMANGIANFHNARRAYTPILNVVGDHATYHRHLDAPLTSDIETLARPFSGWVGTALDAGDIAAQTTEAVSAALGPPGQIATLIVPADAAWTSTSEIGGDEFLPSRAETEEAVISDAAAALTSGKKTAILMTGSAIFEVGLEAAGRIAEATGAEIFADTFNARMQRGAGRVPIRQLPYFAEMAVEALAGIEVLILVETKAPVAFFAYPDKPSQLAPQDSRHIELAAPGADGSAALQALAEIVAPKTKAPVGKILRHDAPTGSLSADTAGVVIARHLPEGAVVSDEGATSTLNAAIHTVNAPPHDWLQLTGGAIGQGLPLSIGAAIACPDRKVVCLHGDGGAMYTVQALWTMAREKLDITTVIFSNRAYAILQIELARVGAGNAGPKALSMLNLTDPDIGWTKLAEGMGVEAFSATTAEEFERVFSTCMAERGPHLIEAVI